MYMRFTVLLLYLGLLATSGEAFSPARHQTIHRSFCFYSPLQGKANDLIFTGDLLERARTILPWEAQQSKDSEPVLNLSTRNSDKLSLADGVDEGAITTVDENDAPDDDGCLWEDGSVWKETERGLVEMGILVDEDSARNPQKLTRDTIFIQAPQLLRLPTGQILESANFFLAPDSTDLRFLLQLDPSLLTYHVGQLNHGVEYLSNMMTRGNRTLALQMIRTQPSMGLQLFKMGVDGGIEELRIARLLGNAGQSSGRAVEGVVSDAGRSYREWKLVKGGKNSLG